MKLNILPTSDYTREYYNTFCKTYHQGDSGIDLIIPCSYQIYRKSVKLIDLEIRCEAFDNDGNPVSYWLLPRSSIYKTSMRQANSMGLIDAGYRGNIKAPLDNISEEDYHLEKGIRLLQICSPTLEPIEVNIVDSLSETDRGEGGFGSTGQ